MAVVFREVSVGLEDDAVLSFWEMSVDVSLISSWSSERREASSALSKRDDRDMMLDSGRQAKEVEVRMRCGGHSHSNSAVAGNCQLREHNNY